MNRIIAILICGLAFAHIAFGQDDPEANTLGAKDSTNRYQQVVGAFIEECEDFVQNRRYVLSVGEFIRLEGPKERPPISEVVFIDAFEPASDYRLQEHGLLPLQGRVRWFPKFTKKGVSFTRGDFVELIEEREIFRLSSKCKKIVVEDGIDKEVGREILCAVFNPFVDSVTFPSRMFGCRDDVGFVRNWLLADHLIRSVNYDEEGNIVAKYRWARIQGSQAFLDAEIKWAKDVGFRPVEHRELVSDNGKRNLTGHSKTTWKQIDGRYLPVQTEVMRHRARGQQSYSLQTEFHFTTNTPGILDFKLPVWRVPLNSVWGSLSSWTAPGSR